MNYEGAPINYPLVNEGPDDFFPPVCNEFHFDPTMVLKHQLPDQPNIPMPLGPRPWTKICLEYVNSATNEPAPYIDPNIAFPSGGFNQDPNKYLASVDSGSQLRRLNQPLRKCDAGQYEPNQKGDMFDSRILVPTVPSRTSEIPDIFMPKSVLSAGPYACRAADDTINTAASSKPFMNATKQDRYYNKENPPANLKTYPNQMSQ
jgi:hypothetical protein